jgi:hypothetical protein
VHGEKVCYSKFANKDIMNTLNAKKKSAEPALWSALNKRTWEHERDDATNGHPSA